jgi:sulfatase-like protein
VSVLPRLRTSTFATLNLVLTLGLLGIYLKRAVLGAESYAVARFLGKNSPDELRIFDRLGFFHSDLVLNLLVVPLVATALVSLVFRRHRVAVGFVTTLAASLVYYIELRAQIEVGQYISRDVLADLVGWGMGHPGMGEGYVSLSSVIKFGALVATLAAIAAVGRLARRAEQDQRVDAARWYRLILQVPAVTLVSAGVLLAIISLPYRLHSQLSDSAVGRAFAALAISSSEPDPSKLLDYDGALAATRLQTRSQPLDPSHPFVGHERDGDLLIFMMETGAAQALDLAQVGRTLPGTGPLYQAALVAEHHYTTHPYSSDALYSILSGLYPQGRRRLLRGVHNRRINALMTAVKIDIPVRRVYVPSIYDIALDQQMYAAFGADVLYAADKQPADPFRTIAERRADELIVELQISGSRFDSRTVERLRSRLSADFQILERVKADITAAVHARQRYAIMFFPEIGHAPWEALHGEQSVLERGRGVMLLQDAWLKELVDTLRTLGRLEQTVITVTGDHGIRTRAEDPALPVGRISDYMFRVPLLIYAPHTLQQTVRISTPTSHVDFAPTIAALFGKTASAARMQGVPIWQRRPRDRLYFLGAAYGGADGFVEDGTYYMRQALSGAVYSNRAFSFADHNQVAAGSPVIKWATDALAEADQLQLALISRLLREPHP